MSVKRPAVIADALEMGRIIGGFAPRGRWGGESATAEMRSRP